MSINRMLVGTAVALVLALPVVAGAKSASLTYPIGTQNGSGEKGSVTLTAMGMKTMVTVDLTGAPAEAQPAHIHTGTCSNLDPAPKYPLTSLKNGKSTTTVDASLASLTAGGYAVNVHKSATDLKDYVACGTLAKAGMGKTMMAPKMMAPASSAMPVPMSTGVPAMPQASPSP